MCVCIKELSRQVGMGGSQKRYPPIIEERWMLLLWKLISHASKVMLKILQARLQQYVNCELPDVQAEFRKGKVTRDKIAKICWIIEKAREFQKTFTSALLTMPKSLTVWITTDCGKFLKRWKYRTT